MVALRIETDECWPDVRSAMPEWLASGRRRDLCVLLYDEEGLRRQELKSRIEDHYDRRLDPATFSRMVDALVDAGYLEERREGVHDVYRLSDAGAQSVRDHLAWMRERVED